MSEKIIILVGPSGAGKTSFLERALSEYKSLRDIITYTTREMRPGEKEGDPYHFVTKEKFEALIKEDFFVEYARVHTNLYGVPEHLIREAWADGDTVIMDIDVQGAETIKKKFPQTLGVFVMPPDLDSLRQRVIGRDGEKPDLEIRMKNAENEMKLAEHFEYQLVNDDFDSCYLGLKKIIDETLNQG
ncbi:MAG: guanylate kinase [Pseudomonadota bacterium]